MSRSSSSHQENCVHRHSLHDLLEAHVVIAGEITNLWTGRLTPPAHDSGRPPIMRTRRLHRVLPIMASRLDRKKMFSIAEYHAVFRVGKRPASVYQSVGHLHLSRQLGQSHCRYAVIRRRLGPCSFARQRACAPQGTRQGKCKSKLFEALKKSLPRLRPAAHRHGFPLNGQTAMVSNRGVKLKPLPQI